MTHADSLIELHGSAVTPYYESKGDADNYGDRATTWIARPSEVIWIQPITRSATQATPAGRINEAEYVAYLKSTSGIAVGDQLVEGSVKYEVTNIHQIKVFRNLDHSEAYLKLIQEG